MTITRRASTFPTGGNSTVATATIPAGVQVGDLLIAAWVTALNTAGWIDPPGWSLLGSGIGSSNNQGLRVFTRVAQSGDAGATVTGTLPGASRQQMSVVAYRTDTPGATVEVDGFAIGNNTATIPALAALATNVVRVAGCGVRNDGSETWTPPASPVAYTEVGEGRSSTGTGGKSQTIAEYLTPVSSGTALGGGSFTSSAGTSRVAWVLGLKEVSASAPPSGSGTGSWRFVGRGGRDLVAEVTASAPPVLIAHRGGAGEAPENTLTALHVALDDNPNVIGEADLQVNASGSLVPMHDTTVDRTAAGGVTGNVSSFTDAQWVDIRIVGPAGWTGGDVPPGFWREMRDEFRHRVLMPEVSSNTARDLLLADVAANPGLTWRLIGQAFDKTRATSLAAAGLRTIQLYGGATPNLSEDAANGMWGIGIDKGHASFNQTLVDNAHALGLKVVVYTVNTTTQRDALHAMGVDLMWTDYPALLAPADPAPGTGSGSGTWGFTGTGAGHRQPVASGSGQVTFAGTGVGRRRPVATGAGQALFTGSGVGRRRPIGSGAGQYAFTGSGTGGRRNRGSGAGQMTFTGTGTGKRRPRATALGVFGFAGSATGRRSPRAVGSGALTWIGTAVGRTRRRGSGAGAFGWVGTGTGAPTAERRDITVLHVAEITRDVVLVEVGRDVTVTPHQQRTVSIEET